MKPGSLQIHRYRLTPRGAGSLSEPARQAGRTEFLGVLLRQRGAKGVGCLHPWPELGDATLEEELGALARGEPLRLGARALQCAAIDGAAREQGVSLFEGMAIPASHYLWSSTDDAGRQAEQVAAGGYPAVKVKLGSDGAGALAVVAAVAELVDVPLRLDFNASLTPVQASALFAALGGDLRARIELVEDPCPYRARDWHRLRSEAGVDLALDWGFSPERGALPEGVDLGVFKPARDDGGMPGPVPVPLLVTGYMDHPIGQMWAAWWAARIAGATLPHAIYRGCGLLTHGHFAGDPALELVVQDGAWLLPPGGTGLGFDDYLEELAWEELP